MTTKPKRELYQLTTEIEGISDSLNTLAQAVCGGAGEVELEPKTIANQLCSLANFLDRITEDMEEIDSYIAKPKSVTQTITRTYNYR